jgi:hypothetical protein
MAFFKKISYDIEYEGNDLTEDLMGAVRMKAVPALEKVMLLLERRIKLRLSQHGKGKWYPSKRGDGTMHQASAPGAPPAPDTETYRKSWKAEWTIVGDELFGKVGTKLWTVFGRRLELGGFGGGAYIAPRPHARPVWDENAHAIQKILDEM